MAFNKVGFIGLGLIGVSIAMNFRRHYPYTKIIASAGSEETIEKPMTWVLSKTNQIFRSGILPTATIFSCVRRHLLISAVYAS